MIFFCLIWWCFILLKISIHGGLPRISSWTHRRLRSKTSTFNGVAFLLFHLMSATLITILLFSIPSTTLSQRGLLSTCFLSNISTRGRGDELVVALLLPDDSHKNVHIETINIWTMPQSLFSACSLSCWNYSTENWCLGSCWECSNRWGYYLLFKAGFRSNKKQLSLNFHAPPTNDKEKGVRRQKTFVVSSSSLLNASRLFLFAID